MIYYVVMMIVEEKNVEGFDYDYDYDYDFSYHYYDDVKNDWNYVFYYCDVVMMMCWWLWCCYVDCVFEIYSFVEMIYHVDHDDGGDDHDLRNGDDDVVVDDHEDDNHDH